MKILHNAKTQKQAEKIIRFGLLCFQTNAKQILCQTNDGREQVDRWSSGGSAE